MSSLQKTTAKTTKTKIKMGITKTNKTSPIKRKTLKTNNKTPKPNPQNSPHSKLKTCLRR